MRQTYIYKNGRLELKMEEKISSGPQMIVDIRPYKSMITGETIDGRSAHRAHLRKHGCIEVGE